MDTDQGGTMINSHDLHFDKQESASSIKQEPASSSKFQGKAEAQKIPEEGLRMKRHSFRRSHVLKGPADSFVVKMQSK